MAGAGIITTGSKPRLLVPGIDKLFGLNYDQLKAKHPEIYSMKSSKKNFEEAVKLVGVGQAELKGEGDAIAADSISQDYARRTPHNVWGKSVRITMEAFEDDLYLSHAQVLSKELAKALFHAKETNAAALFNNATSTSAPYVGADGKAFLASDHPQAGGGTISNLSTSDISELALENAMIAIAGWTDDAGLLMDADVKCLLLPTANRYKVHRILETPLRSGTAENDANALRDRGDIPKVVEWRFLTDTDSWYLLTDVDGLVGYNRTNPTSHYYMDDKTMDHYYSKHERYSFDYYNPLSAYGSLGA